MNVNKLLNNKSLKNLSYIVDYFKCEDFVNLINKYNKLNNHELFINNLDNYISFIKSKIFIDDSILKYLIYKTFFTKDFILLFNNQDNLYNSFELIFMSKYNLNHKLMSNYLEIKKWNFNEFISLINSNKKRINIFFEDISKNNLAFYLELYKCIYYLQ